MFLGLIFLFIWIWLLFPQFLSAGAVILHILLSNLQTCLEKMHFCFEVNQTIIVWETKLNLEAETYIFQAFLRQYK